MKIREEVEALVERVVSVQCDRCSKSITREDYVEWNGWYQISFTGGYGSPFGDGRGVECDLCQKCLHYLIGDFCRERDE